MNSMNRWTQRLLIFLVTVAVVNGGIPNRELSSRSLGLEYCALLRGSTITAENTPSHERMQSMVFHYAPIENILLSAGVGINRLMVDNTFKGRYGFSPSARLALFSPLWFNLFAVTAGGTFVYLNSTDVHDFHYIGPMVDPYGGLRFSFGDFFDLEAGAKGHFVYGTMSNKDRSIEKKFSNNTSVRGYLDVTLYSMSTGAYVSLFADASPEVTTDLSEGPYESTIGISVGIIIKKAREDHSVSVGDTVQSKFPSYKEMKSMQERMAKEVE